MIALAVSVLILVVAVFLLWPFGDDDKLSVEGDNNDDISSSSKTALSLHSKIVRSFPHDPAAFTQGYFISLEFSSSPFPD